MLNRIKNLSWYFYLNFQTRSNSFKSCALNYSTWARKIFLFSRNLIYRVCPCARTGYYLSFALAIFVITMGGSDKIRVRPRGYRKKEEKVSSVLRKVFSFPAIFAGPHLIQSEYWPLYACCPSIRDLIFESNKKNRGNLDTNDIYVFLQIKWNSLNSVLEFQYVSNNKYG